MYNESNNYSSKSSLGGKYMYPITDKLPYEVWLSSFYPDDAFSPDDYLLIYVVSGHPDVMVNDTVWHFSPEDIFVIQPGENYHVLPGKDFLLCTVRMDLNFILRCCDYQRPIFIIEEKDRRLNTGAHADCIPQLLEKIDFLADSYYQKPRANTARLTYHFYEFAWFFIENFRKEPQGEGESQKSQRIWAISDYIKTNYNLPITLGQLADELGLTPQYLSGFIRKHMDTTFNTMLYDIRFKHVLLELAQSGTDITRIILNNGFPNASGFNRMFKNRYHMTPSEYRKKEWKNAPISEHREFPYHLFSQNNGPQYDKYCQARARHRERKASDQTRTLAMDCTKSTPLRHPWGKLVDLNAARYCLDYEYVCQLSWLQRHLPFKYARIQELIHPDILPETADGLCFAAFDTIVDRLHGLGLIPMVVLQLAPDNDFFNIRPFCDRLKKTLMHALSRHGRGYVAQWKVELVRGTEQPLAQYISDSEKIFMAVHTVCSDIGFGGPKLALEHEQPELTALIEGWAQCRIVPDFITVSAYPYADSSTVSNHPDIIYRRLSALHDRLRNLAQKSQWYAGRAMALCVVDFGFTHAPESYMNDSIFMADFMLNNFIPMKDCAEIVGWPAMSDLSGHCRWHDISDPSGRCPGGVSMAKPGADSSKGGRSEDVFHHCGPAAGSPLAGFQGLLTVHGLCKPVFFALKFLCGLGDQLLDAGQGRIITTDGDGRIAMILYNYKHPDAYYCQENNHRMGLHDINRFCGNREPLKFRIRLRHLPADTYEVACYRLDQDNGSLLDLWARSGGIRGIKNETLQYLRHTLAPRVSFYEVKNTDGVLIQETLEAQEVLALVITPKY